MTRQILPLDYYQHDNVLHLAQNLLGKCLITRIEGKITAGMIVETEAYNGALDRASHAYNGLRTARTETMYAQGGVAYIYLCYGIHHLFNIVTAPLNNPQAILIRAIEPIEGIPVMLQRRKMAQSHYRLCSGPGTLSQALGITKQFDGCLLTQAPIWVENRGVTVSKKDILASPRVGIDYAKEHKDLPWRFRLKNNLWTGK